MASGVRLSGGIFAETLRERNTSGSSAQGHACEADPEGGSQRVTDPIRTWPLPLPECAR